MNLNASDVDALVALFRQSSWDELQLDFNGSQLLLSNDSHAGSASQSPQPPPTTASTDESTAAAAVSATHTTARAEHPENWVCIKAPNLGTFYTAPSPDAAPYVSAGDTVTEETEVCLIEVMKLFTTVRAGISGTIREIAVEDGAMVEFDQALLWIEPA